MHNVPFSGVLQIWWGGMQKMQPFSTTKGWNGQVRADHRKSGIHLSGLSWTKSKKWSQQLKMDQLRSQTYASSSINALCPVLCIFGSTWWSYCISIYETFRNVNSLISKHVNVKKVARSLKGNTTLCVFCSVFAVFSSWLQLYTVDWLGMQTTGHITSPLPIIIRLFQPSLEVPILQAKWESSPNIDRIMCYYMLLQLDRKFNFFLVVWHRTSVPNIFAMVLVT